MPYSQTKVQSAADKAIVDAKRLASLKKTTITCINGKATKKAIAIKPKCPMGYKLKRFLERSNTLDWEWISSRFPKKEQAANGMNELHTSSPLDLAILRTNSKKM
jgi:hypothetical protein